MTHPTADAARADDVAAWLALAVAIVDEADPIAMRFFRANPHVSAKPDRTLVTEADQAIERLARERILGAFPDHGIVGEEYGAEAADAPVRWYIDPIDGTSNFVRGVPIFATLLAVERDGELVAAVLSAPALRGRWYATRGGGAWAVDPSGALAPRRLHVSAVRDLADAHILYGSRRDLVASGALPGFDDLVAASWRDRGFGDFWGHVLVAEGTAEAMVEAGLSPWDAAAPALLVEEAGGRWSDVEGRERIDGATYIATNGALHDVVLDRLRVEPRGGPG